MSEQQKDWTECVEEYAELQIGENHLEITGEPYVVNGKYGDRIRIPTTLGLWNISLSSPIARELKKIKEKQHTLTGVGLNVVRVGKDKDTRYTIKKTILPQTQPTLPTNQPQLNLSPEEQATIEEMRRKKSAPTTPTT